MRLGTTNPKTINANFLRLLVEKKPLVDETVIMCVRHIFLHR